MMKELHPTFDAVPAEYEDSAGQEKYRQATGAGEIDGVIDFIVEYFNSDVSGHINDVNS